MILARFLPRDEKFFTHFADAANNAAEAAHRLSELLDNFEDVERKARKIRDLEHRGDEITHRVFNALNSTFVTPLDREDIQALTYQLDDFVDYIEEVARRLWLYRIEQPTELSRLLARILSEQAECLNQGIPKLEHIKRHAEDMRYTVVEVNRLENEADDTLSQALAQLFDGVTDVPGIIKSIRWGEIYQLLEDATDRAEHVANTIEGMMLKYA